MLKARCAHCDAVITYKQGDNGIWFQPATANNTELLQYCWVNPVEGSQLHEPEMDSIREVKEEQK